MRPRLSRRQFLVGGGYGLAALLAACGAQSEPIAIPTKGAATAATPAAAQPTAAGAAKPTTAAAPASGETKPAAAPAGGVAQVPRNETLIMSVSDTLNQMTDVELMNPFITGALRTGWHFAFEPLFYYNPFWNDAVTAPPWLSGKNGEIPYLAESYSYNQDFTEVSVKLRPNITWSDGKPFTARDVVFTLHMLRDNAPKLTWSNDIKLWVKEASAPDDLNVKIALNKRNPNFVFAYLMWWQDNGFPMLPEHIFRDQDPLTFTNYDLAKGWPITTGPWKLVHSSPEQKIWDRRDDWWGAKAGFHRLPKMKRVLVLPHFEDPKLAQLLSGGEVDATHNLQPADTEVVLQRNKKLEVFTADQKAPYGSLDWWPNALGFNDSKEPFNDPEIRWAINYAINRKQIIEVGFRGAGDYTVLPFPAYPAMKPYFEAVQDLLKQTPIDAYDPAKTAQILQAKGWQKDGEGFWAKGGQRFPMTIMLLPGFFQNFAPVIVTQLREAGFDASFKSPTNAGTLQNTGEVDAFLNGHGGGIRDPYLTLNHYHSRYGAPTGEAAARPYRWKNAEFDTIVDEMATVPSSDPKFMDLYKKAMTIWIKELPDIPTVQWYLICPVNITYWKGWPNEKNAYTAPALWHRGAAGLVINTLEPA